MTPLRLTLAAPLAGRIGVLDELKGVAIVLVILYHAGGVLGWADVVHGEAGVDIFVILSGIGLTLGNSGEGAGRYLARRFLRIYPAYWIALTGFLVADAFVRHMYFPAWDVFLHYVGIHAWFGDAHAMSISDSFWFITLIVSLYIVYLPLRRLVDRPDRLLLAGALISIIAACAYLKASQPAGFDHLSLRIPGFFVGLLVGRLLKTGQIEVRPTAALGAAFLVIFYVPYTLGFLFTSVWVGCALMAAYSFLVRPLVPGVMRAALTFLGERSLEIFLIHQPLIREYNVYVLQRYFPNAGFTAWPLTAGMAIGLAAAIGISAALHPFLRRLASNLPTRAVG